MGDIVFNIAKGQGVELYRRVKSSDPTDSAFVIVLLASTGLVSDATLKDYDTLAAVLAGASNEATNTGYARIVLDDSDLAALPAPDDTNDRYNIDLRDFSFTAVDNDGTGEIGKLLVCYDSDTANGNDSNIVPLTAHDWVVTPDGNNLNAVIDTLGFFGAEE